MMKARSHPPPRYRRSPTRHYMEALRFFYEQKGDQLFGPYGFYDAFNLQANWFPQRYLAINEAPSL